jgi:hypothetical protein
MREAERREQAATEYAKNVLAEKEKLNSRLSNLDTGYVSEMEKQNQIIYGSGGCKTSQSKRRW